MSDPAPKPSSYYRSSETAFASLVFLLPLVVVYEIGTWHYTFDPATQTEQRIVAFSMLRDSLAALGATAHWVAPASVVSILLGLAIARREPFRVRPATLFLMACESIALALPLLLLSLAVARIPLLSSEGLGEGVILSIGAGIYEELLFRLIGFALLHFILSDFLALRAAIALPLMVTTSAVAFSVYHYWGPEDFAVQSFVFRALAGAFFGVVMCYRGFGITAGSHAAYDVIVGVLRVWSHGA